AGLGAGDRAVDGGRTSWLPATSGVSSIASRTATSSGQDQGTETSSRCCTGRPYRPVALVGSSPQSTASETRHGPRRRYGPAPVRLVVARCEVTYPGRLTAYLPE